MKKLFITDLKVGDSIFGETFAVKMAKKGAARNNKPFWDIELTDATGSIKGKVWADDMANCEPVTEGDVVNLNATVDEYNGLQLKITNMSKTDKYDLADLQQRSKFDTESMWKEVVGTIADVKNPHLKKLLENTFSDDFVDKFKNSSAAYRVHHAYIGGLLEHTWEMLKMADSLKSHYPKINMDLVKTGILLHDTGKAYEFETGTTINFSDKGRLLGHIFIGAEMIKQNAPKDMPEDLENEIIHIVLSHHGELAHGSPIVPMTVEALAVSTIDMASSKLNMAYNHIHGELGSESYTQYVSQLGTELYRSPYIEELANEDIPF